MPIQAESSRGGGGIIAKLKGSFQKEVIPKEFFDLSSMKKGMKKITEHRASSFVLFT
jgi:hypothetical protein